MKNVLKKIESRLIEKLFHKAFYLQNSGFRFQTVYTGRNLNNSIANTCFNTCGVDKTCINTYIVGAVLIKYLLQKKLAFISLLLFLFIPVIKAQAVGDYAVHANIIYRCTKYINWPNDKKTGDFVIGIVGNSPIYDELKNFTANKTVGNQKIVVKKFSASSASFNSQILFVDEDESRNLKRIAVQTEGTSTLIFSESEGLAHKGSCINFIIVDDHLKLEINKTNIERRNLSIASELLSLGIIVK